MIFRNLKASVLRIVLGVAYVTDRLRTRTIPILLYHAVEPGGSPISIHPEGFARHIAYLRKKDFVFLSLARALDLARRRRDFPPRSVVITFDDGYQNTLHPIRTLLAAGGVPTVFLPTDHLGSDNVWDADHPAIPTMRVFDKDQITMLQKEGCDFGGHTASHARLTDLPVDGIKREIEQCRRDLSALLGAPPSGLAYPYGAFSPVAIQTVRQAGFHAAVTTQKAYWRTGASPFEIPRFSLDDTVDFLIFRLVVHRGYHWYRILARLVYQIFPK